MTAPIHPDPGASPELAARPEDLADIAAGDIALETVRAFEQAAIGREAGRASPNPHPLAALFPLMTGPAFADLCADIAKHGLREPIVTHEGMVLDGRNRLKACIETGTPPEFRHFNGPDPLAFVLSANLHRRHLDESQRAMVAARVATMPRGANQHTEISACSQGKAGELFSVSPDSIQFARKVIDRATPELVTACDQGVVKVSAAAQLADADPAYQLGVLGKIRAGLPVRQATRQLSEDKRKADLERPVTVALPEGIIHGDFYTLSRSVPDDSIDLIFTDPPYDADSVPLYEKAAEVAARILKPGGSFIAYSGVKHQADVVVVCRKHLVHWWTCAVVHEGGDQLLQKLGIRCGWKPLVWFVKQTRGDVQNVMTDIVRGDREKDEHEWQQSTIEARYFIERLSTPGGCVVDFFLGSGTTAVAAAELGRRFIGYEINAGTVERAARRIAP